MKKRPHEHITHPRTIVFLSLLAVFLFVGALFHSVILKNSDLLSAIYPRVLVTLTNIDRQSGSLGELATSPALEEVARMKAEDMASKGYFAHNTPEGYTPWYWFEKAGYEYEYAGENLAVNFTDSEDVEEAWMNSPTHRANIMNGKFTEIGIAMAEGEYQGRKAVFVVQSFGTPKKKLSAPLAVIEDVLKKPFGGVATSTYDVATSAARNLAAASSSVSGANTGVLGTSDPEETFAQSSTTKPSFLDFALTNPQKVLSLFYVVMGGAVVISLTFLLFGEIRHHHLRSAIVSSFFLILIIVLFIIYRYSIFSGFAIG